MRRNRYGEKQGQGEQHTIQHSVEELLTSLGAHDPKARRIAHIHSIWEDIAPASVLDHTDNVFLFVDETSHLRRLIIYVDSSLWAADLMAQKDFFRYRFEEALGEGPIDEIFFRPSSFAYEKHQFKKRRTSDKDDAVEPVELTEQERNRIIEETSFVTDEKLKNTIISARISNKSWQKGLAKKTR